MTIAAIELNKAVSKYFIIREVVRSSTATRLEIDNSPSPEVLENAVALAQTVLDPIRKQFGSFSPQSWYRSEALEKVITKKGYEAWCRKQGKIVCVDSWKEYFSRKSHPRGQAADIEILGISNDYLFDWISKNIKSYDQLIREFPKAGDPSSGWVHISYNKENNRNQKVYIT